jgi:hypothetical protein
MPAGEGTASRPKRSKAMIESLIIFDSSGGTFSPFPIYINSFAFNFFYFLFFNSPLERLTSPVFLFFVALCPTALTGATRAGGIAAVAVVVIGATTVGAATVGGGTRDGAEPEYLTMQE